MTALARHDRELGELGARILLDALSGGERAAQADERPAEMRVPLELVVRASCGCPPSAPNRQEEGAL